MGGVDRRGAGRRGHDLRRPRARRPTTPSVASRRRRCRRPSHAFVADPTDATLAGGQGGWLDARDDYGPTEAFRFYDGPIDNPDDGPEGQINAWPLDEAYIDYVEGDPTAGIINDTADVPEITTDVARGGQRGGRRDEHLHRLARHRVPAVGPGPDATTAPAPARSPTTPTAANAERRATYLTAARPSCWSTTSAVVRDQWDAGRRRTTAAEFLADPEQAVGQHRPRHGRPESPASWPASGWPSPTRRRTRRTSTPASATTPTPTSSNNATRRPDGLPGRVPGRRRAEPARASWPRSTPTSTPRCATQLDDSVADAEAFPSAVRPADRRATTAPGPRGAARPPSRRSRTQGETIAEAAEALGITGEPRGLMRRAGRRRRTRGCPGASSRPAPAAAAPASRRRSAGAVDGTSSRRRRRSGATDAELALRSGRRRHGRSTPRPRRSPCRGRDADARAAAGLRGRQQLLQRQLGDRAGVDDGPRRPRPDVQRPVVLVVPLPRRAGPAARRAPTIPKRGLAAPAQRPGRRTAARRAASRARLRRPAPGPSRSTACRRRATSSITYDRGGRATYADGTPYSLRAPTYAIARPAFGPLAGRPAWSRPALAPPVFGVGLLEARPGSDVSSRRPIPTTPTATASRAARTTSWDVAHAAARSLGRFGWKANVPTVEAAERRRLPRRHRHHLAAAPGAELHAGADRVPRRAERAGRPSSTTPSSTA